MFVSYSSEELRFKGNLEWLEEHIAHIDYVRAKSYDFTATKHWIEDDAHLEVHGYGRPTYRHFVPRREIVDALIRKITGEDMTRRKAFEYLTGVTDALEIPTDENLRAPPNEVLDQMSEEYYEEYSEGYDGAFGRIKEDKRPYNILDYNAWLTWAFESIADWQGNIYLGYGKGDGQGTKIDVPYSPQDSAVEIAFNQFNRCVEYSLRLVLELDTLEYFYEIQMGEIVSAATWRPGGLPYELKGALTEKYLRSKGL